MISININDNLYEDEWGFYVDIEKQNSVTFDNYKIMREKDSFKTTGSSSKNSDINWEYECYLNNKRNNLFINSENKENKKENKSHTNCLQCISKLVSVSITTTFITILTYVVFYVI
jgi:hypothetical protein